MRKLIAVLLMFAIASLPLAGADDDTTADKEAKRLESCGKVLNEVLNTPDRAVPQVILDHATCIVVMPGVKRANGFIFTAGFGGSYGRGAMTCRRGEHFDGSWGAPTMIALEGGSFGIAAGFADSDIVILVMNEAGANSILTSRAKIGGNVTGAAGPVGRDMAAESDAMLHAALLTYSRSKGLFGGAELQGTSLRSDGSANTKVYGQKVSAKQVVLHGADTPPASAKLLLDTLNQRSPQRK